MFGSMYLALDMQNLLRARNQQIVNKTRAEMAETRAATRPRKEGQPGAPPAAVKVYAKIRPKPPDGAQLGRQDLVNVRIGFKDGPPARFHHHGNRKVGARLP